MNRFLALSLAVMTACAAGSDAAPPEPDLPAIDGDGIRRVLADLDRPAVVNVWASWCLPCRSEAPLLAEAHRELGDEVAFIGIDVEDSRPEARAFIDEFDLDFQHYFDVEKEVPAELGGFGVPITYFVEPGGEIMETHSGVLDQPTFDRNLDELRS